MCRFKAWDPLHVRKGARQRHQQGPSRLVAAMPISIPPFCRGRRAFSQCSVMCVCMCMCIGTNVSVHVRTCVKESSNRGKEVRERCLPVIRHDLGAVLVTTTTDTATAFASFAAAAAFLLVLAHSSLVRRV